MVDYSRLIESRYITTRKCRRWNASNAIIICPPMWLIRFFSFQAKPPPPYLSLFQRWDRVGRVHEKNSFRWYFYERIYKIDFEIFFAFIHSYNIMGNDIIWNKDGISVVKLTWFIRVSIPSLSSSRNSFPRLIVDEHHPSTNYSIDVAVICS